MASEDAMVIEAPDGLSPDTQGGWRAPWNIADLLRAADADEDVAPARPVPSAELADQHAEWREACDLAVGLADRVRRSESRIAELEAKNAELESALNSNIAAIALRVHFAETIARRAQNALVAAEERARRAEARAASAEGWLTRVADVARHQLAVALRNKARGARIDGPVFPKHIAPHYAGEPAGKARLRTCLEQYNANKASGANGGLKWIEPGGGYYSACNNVLQEAGPPAQGL
jgi:hypothetical protein